MNTNHRPIRSFVRREGRMTPAQHRAFEELMATYGLSTLSGMIHFQQLFHNDHEVVLEIGYGMGASLLQMAANATDQNFIGVEVHRPGVASLLNGLQAHQLTNVRVFCEDVIEVLNKSIPDNSLDKVMIFFPDPWPKKRHHKRRLIQPAFIQQLLVKMKKDSVIHLATDWQHYAEHMQLVCNENVHLKEYKAGDTLYETIVSQRPETKFERRGKGLGHGIWDFVFQCV